MRVAIVYDRVNKWGGAERVLLALQRIFPSAHLFTSVYNEKKAPWALRNFGQAIKTSFLQKFPLAKNYHQLYASLMPLAFENLNFDRYDLVISVTSEAAKGIITKPYTNHICFCLTPTRYLWSGYDFYFKNPILRNFSRPIVSYLKTWDKIASLRPDSYIAISKKVQKRIKKYYGRTSKVIYPPIGFGLGIEASIDKRQTSDDTGIQNENKNYFLVVSRLVPYKRVDIAIKACNKLKLPLKIVGTGSQEWFLRLIAGSNVEFLGKVSDEKLLSLYQNCKALIFPGIEDFGLVMAEAQSVGAPVIAYRQGGAKEIIKEGKTGEFFNKQDPNSLASVLEKWDYKIYNRDLILKNSQRFSFGNFKAGILNAVKNL